MRTSFHHQPEAQHPIFQLSTSWQADYPIFRGYSGHAASVRGVHLGNQVVGFTGYCPNWGDYPGLPKIQW